MNNSPRRSEAMKRMKVLKAAGKGGKLSAGLAKAGALGRATLRSRIAKGAIATGVAYTLYSNPRWVTAAAGFVGEQLGYPQYLVQAAMWAGIIGLPLLILAPFWFWIVSWIFIPFMVYGTRLAWWSIGKLPNPTKATPSKTKSA